ncbi:MAG: aminoglycoside phosphotransferase family protein [Candidatus Nanopelagicales bacterium]
MDLSLAQHARLDTWGIDCLDPVDHQPGLWWARQGDRFVVVKTGEPADRAREAAALRAFGPAAADVVAYDEALALLVVERMILGDDIRPLARADDDAATREIGLLIARLHTDQHVAEDLPALARNGAAFAHPADPRLPADDEQAARSVFDDLIAAEVEAVVLHGDLHHMNVLRHGEQWRAIDPHGWVGDPTFEAAAMLANPRNMLESGDARGMDGSDLAARVRRRTRIVAEVTGYDVERIEAWAFVGCVIAELWMIESHDLIHGAPLAVAQELLARQA